MPRHLNHIGHPVPNLVPPITNDAYLDIRIFEKTDSDRLHIQIALSYPDNGTIQHFTRTQVIENLKADYETMGPKNFYLEVMTALRQLLGQMQSAIQAGE